MTTIERAPVRGIRILVTILLGGGPSDLLTCGKREHAEEVLHDIQLDLGTGILEQRAGA